MFRLVIFLAFFLGSSVMSILWAQTPAKSGSASPAPGVSVTPSPGSSPAAKSIVDTTDLTDLNEALDLLKKNYIDPEALDERELSRATFEGVLSRLGHGVILLPNPSAEPSPSPVALFGEVLEGHVGYLRLGDLSLPNLESLDAKLDSFAKSKLDSIVIDLRASAVANDFEIGAEFAKRFCPNGSTLFSLQKPATKEKQTFTSDREPGFQGLLIILIDSDTAGAAEAVAGAIKFHQKAVLVGQPTAGRAAEYSDLKLPSGKILRVAVAEAVLPDKEPLFPKGLKPDVPVEMSTSDKRVVFQQSRERGMTPFVMENERPHMNEAALISGKNPELEAMEEAQRKGHSPEQATIHDPVMQRALDLVTSINVFQKR